MGKEHQNIPLCIATATRRSSRAGKQTTLKLQSHGNSKIKRKQRGATASQTRFRHTHSLANENEWTLQWRGKKQKIDNKFFSSTDDDASSLLRREKQNFSFTTSSGDASLPQEVRKLVVVELLTFVRFMAVITEARPKGQKLGFQGHSSSNCRNFGDLNFHFRKLKNLPSGDSIRNRFFKYLIGYHVLFGLIQSTSCRNHFMRKSCTSFFKQKSEFWPVLSRNE